MKALLLDTNIWIEYFRKQPEYLEEVSFLLEEGKVFCNDIVLAELLQGARSSHEHHGIMMLVDVCIAPLNTEIWCRAGAIANELLRKGITKNLLDIVIGVTAIHYDYSLWTLNTKDFSPLIPYGLEMR